VYITVEKKPLKLAMFFIEIFLVSFIDVGKVTLVMNFELSMLFP